jgi:hypothetical protein
MKDSSKGCTSCKTIFGFKADVTELVHRADAPFGSVLYGLIAYINSELDAHMVTHEMEPDAVKERVALHEKTIEVVGRVLKGFMRDCKTHRDDGHVVHDVFALQYASGCDECLEAVVRKARETPVFSAEDAAAVDALTKE